MDIFIKYHIIRRAKELKIKIPENYIAIINNIENVYTKNNIKIRFSILKDGNAKFINATSTIKKYIIFNAEWAARLVLFDDEETKNAFQITLGHELAHKDGDYFNLLFFGKNKRFVNYVNEVHADFGAAEKMANFDRKKLIASMNYKLSLKANDKNTSDHPSWNTRKYYVENYNFNKKLIERIAKDVECNNKDLIEKVYKYYNSNIVLN